MTAKDVNREIDKLHALNVRTHEPHVIHPNAVYDQVALAMCLGLWRNEQDLDDFLKIVPARVVFQSGRRFYWGQQVIDWMNLDGEFKES